MPIQFLVKDNNIYANIVGKDALFFEVVLKLKQYHCKYDGKYWLIPTKKFHSIYEALSDVDRLMLNEDTKAKIEELCLLPTQIKMEHNVFYTSELKAPAIIGKHPYEDYQYQDIRSCFNTNRFALFNEQGTGKSYELISNADLLRQRKGVKKILFITSASGVYNIYKEFQKFSYIDPKRISIGGVDNRRPFDDPNIDVVLLNYRSFLLVSDEYKTIYRKNKKTGVIRKIPPSKEYRKTGIPMKKWLDGDKGILILDESHMIAHPESRQTSVVHLVAPFFEYRYIASGTPADTEEKYYSQLKILDPALVGDLSYSEWLFENFVLGNRYSSYAIQGIKPKKAVLLKKIVEENCVRRMLDDVVALPEQYVQKYYVHLTDLQHEIYKGLVTDRLRHIQESYGALSSREVTNSFQHLILAIDNPKLLLKHTDKMDSSSILGALNRFNFETDHSKVSALLDIVEKNDGKKIVVWTSHPSVAAELSMILAKHHPLVINGESEVPKGMTLDQYKDEIVAKFQTEPKHEILIAGLQVLNTSITLVAANIQIVFDSTFNYTEYDQALKRVRRIGQDKPVYTCVILIDESLDITRYKNLQDKDFINKKFLSQEYLDKQAAQEIFNMVGD